MGKDTITVEVPIRAEGDRVRIEGVANLTRNHWRDIAADPSIALLEVNARIAPAVVAWIERDEWKPLDLPDEGRTIKATLRDGTVETFKVREIDDAHDWARVWKDNFNDGVRFIQRVRDVDGSGFHDIIAWEYVDEPAEPVTSAEQLSVMAQFIEDRCFCGSCGAGEEHARKVLAKAGLVVAGESND